LLSAPVARPAAALREEAYMLDGHALLGGLDHVDQRQPGDRRRCERLHLDAGPGRDPGPGLYPHPVVPDLELDFDAGHGERVAEGEARLATTEEGEARLAPTMVMFWARAKRRLLRAEAGSAWARRAGSWGSARARSGAGRTAGRWPASRRPGATGGSRAPRSSGCCRRSGCAGPRSPTWAHRASASPAPTAG